MFDLRISDVRSPNCTTNVVGIHGSEWRGEALQATEEHGTIIPFGRTHGPPCQSFSIHRLLAT